MDVLVCNSLGYLNYAKGHILYILGVVQCVLELCADVQPGVPQC